MKKKEIKENISGSIKIERDDEYDILIDINTLISFAQRAEQAGATHIKFEVDSDYDSSYANEIEISSVKITVESDEDYNARIAVANLQKEVYEKRKREEAFRRYLELKQIFDPTS
jgi:hypothetical protein